VATTADMRAAPPLLELIGHPVRWQLLLELARSDRRVRELVALIDQPQSLVSYHLGRLQAEDLAVVTKRRSSADGRDHYFSLDLGRCAELLAAAGGSIHPALGAPTIPAPPTATRQRPARVLFLCTGNSARSQIAEVLAQQLGNGSVRAFSAGSSPKPIHPNAIRVAREYGIDLEGRRSKHFSQFLHQRFDHVISLCDRVREVCPEFPGGADLIHWSVPDPSVEGGSDQKIYPAFRRVAADIEKRIRFWLVAIQPTPNGGRFL
jgi:protein-tyrosine-phosphatase